MTTEPQHRYRTSYAAAIRNALDAAGVSEQAAVDLMVEQGADGALEKLTALAADDLALIDSVVHDIAQRYNIDRSIARQAAQWALLSYWAINSDAPSKVDVERLMVGALETIVLASLAARHPDLQASA